MNTDLLERVADFIEHEPDAFDMSVWAKRVPKNICGTQSCVAGTAVLISDEQLAQRYLDNGYVSEATFQVQGAKLLGLRGSQAANLFTPGSGWWQESFAALGIDDDAHYQEQWCDDDGAVSRRNQVVYAKDHATVLRALARGELTLSNKTII